MTDIDPRCSGYYRESGVFRFSACRARHEICPHGLARTCTLRIRESQNIMAPLPKGLLASIPRIVDFSNQRCGIRPFITWSALK
jgi:hypothetical protein